MILQVETGDLWLPKKQRLGFPPRCLAKDSGERDFFEAYHHLDGHEVHMIVALKKFMTF